jgi:hypothetical protein
MNIKIIDYNSVVDLDLDRVGSASFCRVSINSQHMYCILCRDPVSGCLAQRVVR